MDATTRNRVRERAGNRCEYCTLHQSDSPLAALQIEHIRAKKHGGTDDLDNLALACIDCNLHKGPNLAASIPRQGILQGITIRGPRHKPYSCAAKERHLGFHVLP